MVNPCNECIVRAMCEVGCSKLSNYIRGRMKILDHPHYTKFDYDFVAKSVRNGTYELIHNDTLWRRKND